MSVDETCSPTNARYYDLFWTARSRQLARGSGAHDAGRADAHSGSVL